MACTVSPQPHSRGWQTCLSSRRDREQAISKALREALQGEGLASVKASHGSERYGERHDVTAMLDRVE